MQEQPAPNQQNEPGEPAVDPHDGASLHEDSWRILPAIFARLHQAVGHWYLKIEGYGREIKMWTIEEKGDIRALKRLDENTKTFDPPR